MLLAQAFQLAREVFALFIAGSKLLAFVSYRYIQLNVYEAM